MKSALSNTFIIPVINDFLVYSPLAGISAMVNRRAVVELKDQLLSVNEKGMNRDSPLFELAQDIAVSPLPSPGRRSGKLNPEFLGIIPTRSCNGACNYCDFEADLSSGQKMSYELAVRAVDWYADLLTSQKRDRLDIHFFGGEPMMARDVMEVTVQRARLVAVERDMIPYFEISTNGQYSAGDAAWLGKYFNKIILSFDGFREIQNRHRPLIANKSSYENVSETARIISNSNADLCIRCCVSEENILQIEEFTGWLCENFRLSAINFEILTVSAPSVKTGLCPPGPVDFALHFERSREIAKRYGVDVVYASDINGCTVISSCPVGKDTAIVSPDGRISNCYLQAAKWQEVGLDLDFGLFSGSGDVKIEHGNLEAIRKLVENKTRCKNCFCKWSCAGGCHVGITYPGSTDKYDNFCIQTRLISIFTLLSRLGLQEHINRMTQSPQAIQSVVSQQSDCLKDFTS
jgi:uncharacterized protein